MALEPFTGRLVISPDAAGFAVHETYEVRLLAGKKILAKAELLLRD